LVLEKALVKALVMVRGLALKKALVMVRSLALE